jgi:hypothetical protein
MEKNIKLAPQYRQKRHEQMPTIVPKFTVQGKWLAEHGFFPGKVVRVEVFNNQMIITSRD